MPRISLPRLVAAALFLIPALAAAQPAAPPRMPVAVLPLAEEDVTQAQTFIGRIEARERVALVARVTGFLERQGFRDGQAVNRDDVLFEIEREPFAAAVSAARATLASAEALKQNADLQLQRADELMRTNNIPAATRDQRRAEAASAAARVLEAQAGLEQAEINLGYTRIRAPVAGRIGRASVSVGNVVSPQSGTLALILSQDPMHVVFPVSQRILLAIRREQQQRAQEARPVRVRVVHADGSLHPEAGEIDFVDVTVAQGTDTVNLRARIADPAGLLTDGQLVSVRVEDREPEKRIVVPQAALMLDQQGAFVFVVEQDRAALRRIRTGQSLGARITVLDGLKPGDMLIVDGLQRIRPGAPVQATPAPPAIQRPAGRAG